MKAGAVDYLPKPFRDEELLCAVERALKRSSEQWLQRWERKAVRDRLSTLTPREFDVLKDVIAGMLKKTNCCATRRNRGDHQGPSRARYGEDGSDIGGGTRDSRAEARGRTDLDGCY
jgi:hypothetical protein